MEDDRPARQASVIGLSRSGPWLGFGYVDMFNANFGDLKSGDLDVMREADLSNPAVSG